MAGFSDKGNFGPQGKGVFGRRTGPSLGSEWKIHTTAAKMLDGDDLREETKAIRSILKKRKENAGINIEYKTAQENLQDMLALQNLQLDAFIAEGKVGAKSDAGAEGVERAIEALEQAGSDRREVCEELERRIEDAIEKITAASKDCSKELDQAIDDAVEKTTTDTVKGVKGLVQKAQVTWRQESMSMPLRKSQLILPRRPTL